MLDRAVRLRVALRRRRGRPKRVLLDASNGLMADYVLRLWAATGPPPGITAALTRFPGASDEHEARRRELDLHWVDRWRGALHAWDLLLLADHAPLRYAPSIPRVIVAHGVARARHVREGSYYYDRQRLFWPDGRPVYEVMFEASDEGRRTGVQLVPEYAGRIEVVGDLRVDEMVRAAEGSGDLRGSLGWDGRRIVLVMSTWSRHALITSHGAAMLAALQALIDRGDHAAVVTMHPNLWDEKRCGTDAWRRLVERAAGPYLRVLQPEEDWAPWLALADVAVTDHTSLAATFAVLERPMLPVSVPDGVVAEGTFAAWLLDAVDPLTDPNELGDALERVVSQPVPTAGRPRIVDHLGDAAARTAAVLQPLLMHSR